MVILGNKNSYGAILTVLIIGFFLALMSVSFTLQSQSRLRKIDSVYKKAKGLTLAESCVEDVIARSNADNEIPASIVLPEGTCTIEYNSHPVFRVINVTVNIDGHKSIVEVSTTLPPGQQKKNGNANTKFGVLYWHQIE